MHRTLLLLLLTACTEADSAPTEAPAAVLVDEGVLPGWDSSPLKAEGLDPMGGYVRTWFSPALEARSATMGWRVARQAEGFPIGLVFGSEGRSVWDMALDAGTDDLVLAYDHSIPGDVLRLAPGGFTWLGPGVGTPDRTTRLTVLSGPQDSTTLALVTGQRDQYAWTVRDYESPPVASLTGRGVLTLDRRSDDSPTALVFSQGPAVWRLRLGGPPDYALRIERGDSLRLALSPDGGLLVPVDTALVDLSALVLELEQRVRALERVRP